jgi:LPXTG-site transpeptidase (sortase) family protein
VPGLVVAALLLTSCAAGADDDAAGTVPSSSAAPAASPTAAVPPAPAREGRVAPGRRVTFVPAEVRLPDGRSAPVEPAATRDGVLDVPSRVDRVGWWDGSAQVGDPYGSTVLAGHVDSREQGLGFFAGLLAVQVGQVLEVAGDGRTASYRVTEVQDVPKEALATSGSALDQRGPHRLVLITCTGEFDPVARHYDHNLVVTAVPVAAPG